MSKSRLPIAIYYEHPEWFRPLFAELDRRGTPYVRLDASCHRYDPADGERKYALLFNRMSASAYTRGHGRGTFYTHYYLAHLERLGVPVVNGSRAFAIETSKALQLSLFTALGLAHPRTLIINCAADAAAAAHEVGYPVIIKPNIGGAGAGVARYDTPDALEQAVAEGRLDLGFDHTAQVQEFIPARGGHITRIETLDRRFLYAIRVQTTGDRFNLCPAEVCQVPEPAAPAGAACVLEAQHSGLKVEACAPPDEMVAAVERIVEAAEIDVGGVEYIVDDRDGQRLFYDINALSNFVADAPRVVGFDPHARLVDYLERRAF